MKKLTIVLCLFVGLSALAKPSAQQHVDGSADSYKNEKSGEVKPEVRVENGKEYLYWPGWNKSKNQKLQVRRERTDHPDAQWWPHAGLGIFMHWGIVSEFEPTGEAWAGRWTPDREKRGEFHPQQEIWDAAKTFNPTKYDPEKWMAGAKRAGFKYAVLTTKHHDGYALWDSDWALMGVRQYLDGWDLVDGFVKACRNNDLKVGFYYSGMDWYFIRDYMNFSFDPNKKMNFKGEWVKTLPKEPQGMWGCYCQYNEGQVKELIEKFDPDIWWGDGGHGMSVEAIRKLRPGIVCNNRDPGSGDHATAEGFGMSDPKYIKPLVKNGWWWEVNSIIQKGSWHYDARKGEELYPSDEVLRKLAEARCMGGNLLANIGPRPDGTYQDQVWRLFDDMEEWMKTNEESVFGINGGGPWPERCNVPITAKDRNWYFHCRDHEATEKDPVVLKDCAAKPKSMTLLNTGDKIQFTYKDGTLSFSIPSTLKAGNITDVVKVEFGDDFDPKPFLFTNW
ncbi:alpha-L-fucosidase [Pontiellaceae bacterium B12227]|nr:alpha-L-fucosidase [Pontiellaceae bacterium B12227]